VIWDRRPLPLRGPGGAGGGDDVMGGPGGSLIRQPSSPHERNWQAWGASWLGAGFGSSGDGSSRAGSSGGGAAAAGAAGGALAPAGAEYWIVHVLERGLSDTPIRESHLSLRSGERTRRHVSLQRGGADWLWSAELANVTLHFGGSLSGVAPRPSGRAGAAARATRSLDDATSGDGSPSAARRAAGGGGGGPDPGSFSTMLSALLTARTAAQAAGTLYELAGPEWWDARGEAPPPAPPEGVMLGVLRDLFAPGAGRRAAASTTASGAAASVSASGGSFGAGVAAGSYDGADSLSQHQQVFQHCDALPRSAARDSLLGRLALHCMTFGNARAVALLWHRFVDEVRLRYWEGRALLPRMPAGATAGGAGSPARGGARQGAAAATPHRRPRAGQGDDDAVARRHAQVGGPPAPNHGACLIHQKLQMLNVCIFRSSARAQHNPQRARRGSGEGAGAFAGGGGRGLERQASVQEEGEGEQGGEASTTAGSESEASTAAAARRLAGSGPSSGAMSAGAASDFHSVGGGDGSPEEEEEEGWGESAGSGRQQARKGGAQQRQRRRLPPAGSGGDEEEEEDEDFKDALEEGPDSRSVSFASTATAAGAAGDSAPAAEDGFGDAVESAEAAAAGGGDGAWAAPQGVLEVLEGRALRRYPDRPLRVPITLVSRSFLVAFRAVFYVLVVCLLTCHVTHLSNASAFAIRLNSRSPPSTPKTSTLRCRPRGRRRTARAAAGAPRPRRAPRCLTRCACTR
jgi:hypothetical protein